MNSKKNNLLQVSFKNGSQVLIRAMLGVLNIKLSAILLGPSGIAIYSQLQNFLQIGANISGAGINHGITKLLSEYPRKPIRDKLIINTGFAISLMTSTLLGLLILFYSKNISKLLFTDEKHYYLISTSVIYFISITAFNLIISIISGFQNLKKYIILNLTYTFINFSTIITSMYFWGLAGALWASILHAIVPIIFALKTLPYSYKKIKLTSSKAVAKKLTKFAVMAIVAGIIFPTSNIIIRNYISSNISTDAAGIWDGINKISSSYILLISLTFNYYFLPKFSTLKSNISIHKEMKRIFFLFIPLLILSAITLYTFRYFIISTILDIRFLNASTIIHWQILGDIFRILNWIIGLLLISKEKTTLFIATEFFSGTLLTLGSCLLINIFDLEGATLGYFIENCSSFLLLLLCSRIYLSK